MDNLHFYVGEHTPIDTWFLLIEEYGWLIVRVVNAATGSLEESWLISRLMMPTNM